MPTGQATPEQIAQLEAMVTQTSPLKHSSLLVNPAKMKKSFTVHPDTTVDGVTPHLDYYGGPMLESVEIYVVFWGANVNAMTQAGIPGMLSTVAGAGSPYMSMLQMYNSGTPYTIGNGVYMGSITDVNAPLPASGSLDDSTIRGELSRLIDTGELPPNNGHNIYMVYFPLDSVGTTPLRIHHGSETSCTQFCAYHNTYTRNGNNVYYGVMPDLDNTGPCKAPGCGSDTPLNNLYATTSHELIEAVTDAAVGLATDFAPPLAWYDNTLGDNEIGDICAYIDDTSGGYHVQTEWLNEPVNGCSAHPATVTPDVLAWDNSLSSDATKIFVQSGGPASAAATISVTGGAGAVALKSTPNFGTAIVPTFSQPTITPGGTDSSTLTYTAPAGFVTQGPFQMQIEGLDADGITHLIKPLLYLIGPAPTITSITPNNGPTQGGPPTVAVVGTGFGNPVTVTVQGAGDANPIPVTRTRTDAQHLTLTMPGHAAGAVTLKIANLDGANATTTYTYNAGAAPTVTAVSPATGPFAGGQQVTVTGTNFSSTSTMTFDGVALDCDPASNNPDCRFTSATTAVVFGTPPFQGGANPVTIQVTNADGQSGTSTPIYTYANNTTPPVIASLSVTMGPTTGGTYVTIYGSNFGASPTVKFGGNPATVTTANDSFLGVFTPAHAAGAVNVVVVNPDAESATAAMQFTYVAAAAPTITGINPSYGAPAGGDVVVISGTGFANAAVTFGGATAFVHPGATATSLTVTTPAHAGGTVPVVVKNGDGQTATTSFLYGVPDMAMPPPADLAIPNDLSVPPDMTLPPDMVVPNDLSVPADLTATPDDLTSGGGGTGGTGGGGGTGGTGGTGGGGGTGGTGGGGGGGSGGHGGCSAAPGGSSSAPATLVFAFGLLGLALRRRSV